MQREIIQRMTLEKRLSVARGLYVSLLRWKTVGLRHHHQDWSKVRIFEYTAEIFLRCAERNAAEIREIYDLTCDQINAFTLCEWMEQGLAENSSITPVTPAQGALTTYIGKKKHKHHHKKHHKKHKKHHKKKQA